MSKVQVRMVQRFSQRLFGLCFLLLLFFSVITPSEGICSSSSLRVDFSADKNSVCDGQFVMFTASTTSGTANSLLWDVDNNGTVDYTGPVVRHTYSKPGNYTVRLVGLGQNMADAEVKENFITVHPKVKLSVMANATEICSGKNVIVRASGADNYTWSYSDGLRWSGTSAIAFQPRNSGTLTVVGTSTNGCTDVKTISFKVFALPTAKTIITHPTDGNNGVLSVYGEKGLPPYLYQVNGNGFTNNGLFTNLPAGEHTLTIRDANGCESMVPFTLNAPMTCGAPQNLTVTRVGSNFADLSWTEVPGATSYTIYGAANDEAYQAFEWRVNAVRFSPLVPNANYRVYVVANCPNGKSQPSQILRYTMPSAPTCPRPNIWLTNITSDYAVVNFNFTERNTTTELSLWYRKTGDFNWIQRTISDLSTGKVELMSLNENTEYEIRLGNVCKGTSGSWSETIIFRTMPKGCSTPMGGKVEPTAMSANVSWNSSSEATAYALRWKSANSNRWRTRVFAPNVTNFNVSGLMPSSTYDLMLTTICGPAVESEGWMVQFNTASARELQTVSNNQVNVYPNPTTGIFEVNTSGMNIQDAQISVMDLTGKEVKYMNLSNIVGSSFTVNLEDVPAGIYLLGLNLNGETFTQKLIVE